VTHLPVALFTVMRLVMPSTGVDCLTPQRRQYLSRSCKSMPQAPQIFITFVWFGSPMSARYQATSRLLHMSYTVQLPVITYIQIPTL
jgi:hypothetical protein